jgi:hypothetical protein
MAMDTSATNGGVVELKDKESMVDPFLVEALQNPRHRLTSQLHLLFSFFSNLFTFLALTLVYQAPI